MEHLETTTQKAGKSRSRKVLELILGLALLAVILFLAHSLISQLQLNSEVKASKAVTNQVISDIRRKDGAAVRKLGDKTFQSQNTVTNLTAQFKAASSVTASTPTISTQTVTNDKTGQAASVIYKFPKPVFYIRVIVTKPKGSSTFHVVNLKADTSNLNLLDNKY